MTTMKMKSHRTIKTSGKGFILNKCIRSVIIGMLVIAIFLSFGGCRNSEVSKVGDDNKGVPGSEVQKKNIPEKLEDPNLKVLVINDVDKGGYAEAEAMYCEKYGGTVEYEMVLFKEKEAKLAVSISAGNPYDVMRWATTEMPRYAIKGLLQPIDTYFDFKDPLWTDVLSAMDHYKWNGKYYGISLGNGAPMFLYYNKSIFENNGLKTPTEYYKEGKWNWETLRELAIKLTQDTDRNGLIDQWGFALSVSRLEVFLAANDADFIEFKDDGSLKSALDDNRVVQALQFYQDGCFNDKFLSPVPAYDKEFLEGRVAMIVDRPSMGKKLATDAKFEWDIALFPGGPANEKGLSLVYNDYFGICTGSRNPKGAAALLSFHKKAAAEKRNTDLEESFTKEQVDFIVSSRNNARRSVYKGIGNLDEKTKPMWKDVKNGVPVVSTIEKYKPVFQEEVDLILKELK